MRMRNLLSLLVSITLLFGFVQASMGAAVQAPADIKATTSSGIEYLNPVPMTKYITAKKGAVQSGRKMPVITWGADVANIYANGGKTTQPGSIFAREGLQFDLFREDNFPRAVEMVVRGDTPYLRGTLDMVHSALEALKDRGIEMVVVVQLSFSTGGDTFVVRSDQVKSCADLRGKYVGVQLYGPHMAYLANILRDCGLSLGDVKIRWLRELTIPPYNTKVAVDPMTAMQKDPTLAAVTVISPDKDALTSGGTIGTGAESSVKGAKMMLSTRTAGRVIADVYAVRKDYLDAHRDEVNKFVHGMLVAQEELKDLLANKKQRTAEYQTLLKTSAELLRDSAQATADIEGLLGDMTLVGYRGNVDFFGGQNYPRRFEILNMEASSALIAFGLLSQAIPLTHAKWDYAKLAAGLKDTAGVTVPRFDEKKVEQVVADRALKGKSEEGVLWTFDILFQPNQSDFPVDQYRGDFTKVVNLAAKYPGALIEIEGHADPARYIERQSAGASQQELDRIKQAAKNTSLQRALKVRDSLIAYAKSQNLTLDTSQFTVTGAGLEKPKFQNQRDQQSGRWYADPRNMRVNFKFIQIEGESENLAPTAPKGK